MKLFALIGIAVVVFASTNVDDILLLAAFFADPRMRARTVVVGQFVGIGGLVTVSVAAALASFAVPEGWTALLGMVPLLLGVWKLVALLRRRGDKGLESEMMAATERNTRSHVWAVAGVTAANGGDNLGVYIPLFAKEVTAIPVYIAVFAVMTAVWCLIGHRLVKNRWVGEIIARYAHVLLPFVLMGLGVYILAGARVLVGW